MSEQKSTVSLFVLYGDSDEFVTPQVQTRRRIGNMSTHYPIVAHLLRPAQGGMRELVRALLLAAPPGSPPLLLAPPDTLSELVDAVPGESRRSVLSLDSMAPHHLLSSGQTAGRFAKNRGAQLLHGHGLRYAPLFAAASVTSGLPLVVSLHNLVPDDLTGLQRAAARAALSRATYVIAVSRAVAQSAIAVADASRIVTIPNGIDTARFTIPDAERLARRHAMRESLGIELDAPVAVCLSRLSPEKDVTNLLEAFALCADTLAPSTRLLIAGDGRLRASLEWHIDLLGLHGWAVLLGGFDRERVPDLLFAADVFALSSREEGLSLAVLEAMAAGLPVVATAVGGLPEAVAHGVTGLLAPPRDPAAFATALRQLLTDGGTRKLLGDAGKNRIAERFTQERMIAETFALYEWVVRGR